MAKRSRVNPGPPKSVRKAALEAERLHKQVYGDPDNDTTELAETPVAPGGAQTDEGGDIQPVETQAPTDTVEDTDGESPPSAAEDNLEATPDAQEVAAPESAEKPAETQERQAEDWQAKYNSLQGKYNAEVPRLAAELRSLRQEMSQVQQARQAPPQEAGTAPEKKSVVSEQDTTDYGEDLIDLIRRVARGEATDLANQLTPQISTIKDQVARAETRQVTTGIYSTLDSAVQDWREINKSADFLAWLDQSDPYAGDLRKNLLGAAFKVGDSARVVAFFKGYLAERQAVAPTPAPTPAPQARPAPQVPLEKLAGPAAGVSVSEVATNASPQTPSWNRAAIAAFYRDVSTGAYAKDPAKKAQIENSIATALKRGSVA